MTKVFQGIFTPIQGAQRGGGSMKFAPYMYALSKIVIPEKNIKMLHRFKMAAKKLIFIPCHFDFDKNLKNHFLKGIFNEIWLKVGIDLH